MNLADDSQDIQGIGPESSLTLGQLRTMVQAQAKTPPQQYAMRYEDEDTVFEELEEFLSYQEVQQLSYNLNAWEGSFRGDWTKSSIASRKAHVSVLLESLEHKDADVRLANVRKLLYIIQGTFAESTSPEHHLHMIIENCKIVRAANGFGDIVGALKTCNAKHDLVCNLTDEDVDRLDITEAIRQESLMDLEWEISCYCNMLYFMMQIFKGDDEFGDELMSMEPPFPHFMFSMLAAIREKSVRSYPVKKVLLLTYKAQLTCFGGIRELARVKKIARELAGLPSESESAGNLKSSPIDFRQFRQETSVKYPTFAPSRPGEKTTEMIATAIMPVALRSPFGNFASEDNGTSGMMSNAQRQQPQAPQQLPPTPAPSPPPNNGRPKKQLYQTDPNRPFLFPFSRGSGQSTKLVPFALDEADRLYRRHMHVSLALYQMWQTREACLLDESGVDPLSPEGIATLDRESSGLLNQINGSNSFPHSKNPASDVDASEQALPDVRRLDTAIVEAQRALDKAEADGDRPARRKAKERLDDFTRLRRIEAFYSFALPYVNAWVLVVLRIVLNTVRLDQHGGGALQQNQANTAFPPAITDSPAPPPTLDEIDRERHREISLKAVSGLMLLTLKWFKASNAMQFQHFAGVLLDSNIVLLILKVFGIQETAVFVQAKNDSPDHNFFRYCSLHFAKNAQSFRPEDAMLNAPRSAAPPPGSADGEDIEYITDYSWRNFFTTISFVKVMQKLTKGRSYRIGMLVSYKSSAIMKRMLKVAHPVLQLHVLKLIKSQVPYCGRKWRQTNMKVITSIYLNCRPDLRDEWLAGGEMEDTHDSQAQELALRALTKFYNSKRYGISPHGGAVQPSHRRTTSQSMHPSDSNLHSDMHGMNRPLPSPHYEMDVFPPLRSRVSDPSSFAHYTTEDLAFEEDYEDYLLDLNHEDTPPDGFEHPFPGDWGEEGSGGLASAWYRIERLATGMGDDISDSESIVSIGELGEEDRHDGSSSYSESEPEVTDQNVNNWEHMSPKTLKALPKSPASGGRRSSSGGANLRPVIPFGLDDGSAVVDDYDDLDDDDPGMGPMPTGRTAPFAAGEGGKGVDEVEYMYGE